MPPERSPSFNDQPHADRRRVPPAGHQPAEQTVPGCLLVEMEWLRIELRGETQDLGSFEDVGPADEAVADLEIVQEQRSVRVGGHGGGWVGLSH